jgi:hypothetical protein
MWTASAPDLLSPVKFLHSFSSRYANSRLFTVLSLSSSVLSRTVMSRLWESVLRMQSAFVLRISVFVSVSSYYVHTCHSRFQSRFICPPVFDPCVLSHSYPSSESVYRLPGMYVISSRQLNLSSNQYQVTVSCLFSWYGCMRGILYCFGFNWISSFNVQSEGKVCFKEGKGRSQLLYQLLLGHGKLLSCSGLSQPPIQSPIQNK